MRIIAIGDIHGNDNYRKVVDKELENADKIVFVGDYLDSRNPQNSAAVQEHELKNILSLKEQYPDKIVLLIGNHDHHYLQSAKDKQDTCTGFQQFSHFVYTPYIEEAVKERKMQLAYNYKNILFTHAGVTNSWLRVMEIPNDENLVDTLNDLLVYKPLVYGFMHTWELVVKGRSMAKKDRSLKVQQFYAEQSGESILYSPIWVRPKSLFNDLPRGYVQIVGHTGSLQPKLYKNVYKQIEMITVDCLHSCYLEIVENEDGTFQYNTKDIH